MKHLLLGSLLTLLWSACGPSQPAYFHEAMALADHPEWAGEFLQARGEIRFSTKNKFGHKSIEQYPADSAQFRNSESCLLAVDPEKDANMKQQVLQKLTRIWQRYLGDSSPTAAQVPGVETERPAYSVFEFDTWIQTASFGPGGFLEPARAIRYRRLCLSTPLRRTDAYNEMRILEIESAQNAAIAAFGFRLQKRNDRKKGDILLMSRLHFDRYGQEVHFLKAVDTVFAPYSDQELGVPIWVFLGN